MEIPDNNDDVFNSKEFRGCLAAIEKIAGYRLSAAERQPFLLFHNFVTNPQPKFLTDWRADKTTEHWYHDFINGILMNVQDTYACVFFHFENLIKIEKELLEAIERFDYRRVLKNSTIGMGNTKRWDFEFQAFILAFRRCLDLLARAVSSFFKSEFHSFRRLGAFLKKVKPEVVANRIIQTHEKYVGKFEFVISDSEKKSLRDKIAHYSYVPVGTINLSSRGFLLAADNGLLKNSDVSQRVLLSEVLNRHILVFRECVRESIICLVDGIGAWEYERKASNAA